MEQSDAAKAALPAPADLDGKLIVVIDDEAAYIIISCDAIKHGTAKPLKEVRPDIERAIQAEKSKVVIDKWMEGLRKRSVIKKFGWN